MVALQEGAPARAPALAANYRERDCLWDEKYGVASEGVGRRLILRRLAFDELAGSFAGANNRLDER